MTSCKPYLVRAMYEWIQDNNCTPYIVVNAEYPYVQVPREYVKDGQIVLNISSQSTGALNMNNEDIEFNARFGGQARHIIIPVGAVLYIYARETGEGMPFPPEPVDEDELSLNEVEGSTAETVVDEPSSPETATKPSLSAVPPSGNTETNKPDAKAKKRDHLKVIK
ncbi:ClpXP protease specificity-enhancing factor [Saccharobesus litoralis]|uniref:ClpXP protease specificity-enhancing factor n=2 Tax=Saccharobesus litoralis TaxID=2172099 RepID=A0A2S0VY25_9ALTE|nr:ClpXP protease specificity-enhancing factor [Saccharobesus litoralis]